MKNHVSNDEKMITLSNFGLKTIIIIIIKNTQRYRKYYINKVNEIYQTPRKHLMHLPRFIIQRGIVAETLPVSRYIEFQW